MLRNFWQKTFFTTYDFTKLELSGMSELEYKLAMEKIRLESEEREKEREEREKEHEREERERTRI